MKLTDLMIGDWYAWEAEGKLYCYRVTKETFSEDEDAVISNFQPVKLTPEILERNGFTRSVDDGHFRYTLIEGSTSFSVKYARNVFQWMYPLDIRFVHELQHILKICGIKKEIKL